MKTLLIVALLTIGGMTAAKSFAEDTGAKLAAKSAAAYTIK